MGRVLHFAIEGAEKAACGAPIILCADGTDDRRHVECGRCKRTKQMREYDPRRFDVDVWDDEGDVVLWLRSVSAADVANTEAMYADDPTLCVVATEVAGAGT